MASTIVEMFRAQIARNPDRPALRTKAGGVWVTRSWREWGETSLSIAAGLVDLGVRPGDRVAIFSGTRREWVEADLGVLSAGAVTVPLYPQTTAEHAAFMLADSDCTVAFVEDPLQLEKLFAPGAREKLRQLRRVVYFDPRRRLERPDARGRLEVRLEDVLPRAERSSVMAYGELLAAGRKLLERDEEGRVRARGEALGANDLASVVYTSGTSGPPRGVALTHGNFVFECANVGEQLALGPDDEQLLLLPLAHIFARVLAVAAVRVGYCTAFASSPLGALDELLEVNPTFFGAVPRLFEKMHASVLRRLAEESPLRRRVAQAALEVGRRVSALRQRGESPGRVLAASHRAASAAVLEQVRRLFGRRLRFAISGGAPLPREVAEFFHACDVLVLEGYGLTETTAATHVNRPTHFKLGTVGTPVPGVEARVAADGEVLVRGGSVMQGYFKQPEATREALDEQGWFATGDIGAIDAEGFLTITDRKKDVIVTAGGKNVAPQNLEEALRRSPWIAQAVVLGDDRPYLVALLALDEQAARAWAREHGVGEGAALAAHPDVRRAVGEVVATVNGTLESFQQIRRWKLLGRELSVERGELTATMKVRRRAVAQKYVAEIEALYRGDDA